MVPYSILSAIPENLLKKTSAAVPFLTDLFQRHKRLWVQKLHFHREAGPGGGDGSWISAAAPCRGKARFLRYGGWK